MQTVPLKPSVELPIGPRGAVLGGEDACELCNWDLRRSSLWGHETLYWVVGRMQTVPVGTSVELPVGLRNVVLIGRDACEFCQWSRRWSSLRGNARELCNWDLRWIF
eukprot:8637251-Pyramimonas_sp.AAC.1